MALQLTLSCDSDKSQTGPTLIHSTGVQGYKIPVEVIQTLQQNLSNDILSDHEEGVLCQEGPQRILSILRQNGFALQKQTSEANRALWTLVQSGGNVASSSGGSTVSQLTLSYDSNQAQSGPTLIHSAGVEHYKIPPEAIRALQENLSQDLLSDHDQGVLCQESPQRVLDALRSIGFNLQNQTTNNNRGVWTLVQGGGSSGGGGGQQPVLPPAPQPTPSGDNDADAGGEDQGENNNNNEEEKGGEEEEDEKEE